MKRYYYVGGQNQALGPVTAKQLVDMVNTRLINPETLVVPEGESQWRPLSQFRQQQASVTPTIDPTAPDFYVYQNGQTLGPYSSDQLDQMRSNRSLSAQAQVARGGGDKWVPIASFVGGAILGFLATHFTQTARAGQPSQYYYSFEDGETYDAVLLDMDGDGIVDGVAIDTDHDGVADVVGLDTNGDGQIDAVGQDLDHNGTIDVVGIDTNHDGRIDLAGADSDGDGSIDLVAADNNFDGKVDFVGADTNQDGGLDTCVVDTDFDGTADFAADYDGGGISDSLSDLSDLFG